MVHETAFLNYDGEKRRFLSSYVIRLNNSQRSYARALEIVGQIERGSFTGVTQAAKEDGIFDVSKMQAAYPISPRDWIIKAVAAPRMPEKNEWAPAGNNIGPGQAAYIFWVQMTTQLGDGRQAAEDENIDIVNLQYLLTAWQTYAGEIFLYLDNDSENQTMVRSSYHKLSQYLYFASCYGQTRGASFYNAVYACYYDADHLRRIQRLQKKGIPLDNLKKFVPLLYIDKLSRAIFSKNVANILEQRGGDDPLSAQQDALWNICYNYLSQSQSYEPAELTDAELTKQFGDMSILSFYIYCVFRFFASSEFMQDHYIESDFSNEKLISDVQDYASGIKELVDNVVRHSDSHTGYLGIRIHSHDKISGLTQRCPGYFQEHTPDGYYLEVCITDSHLPAQNRQGPDADCIMVRKFLTNLESRKAREYQSDDSRDKIHGFMRKFKTAALRDFFDPKHTPDPGTDGFSIRDWDTFYSITDNVLHHYGLMQFTSIVKSRKGYFKVHSCDAFLGGNNCEYSTKEAGGTHSEYCIPGTQYTIVLPIHLKADQYATGFSAPASELDFSKLSSLRQVDYPHIDQAWKNLMPRYMEDDDALYSASQSAYSVLKRWFLGGWRKEINCKLPEECDPVFSFDWSSFNNDLREVFLKGLFYYIADTRNRTTPLRIAIYNCSFAALLQCIELFLAFYNRSSEQKAMRYVDIYLVEKDCRDDFLISGENLQRAVALSERIAFGKGRFTLLHTIFSTKIWGEPKEVPPAVDADGKPIKYIPYDVMIKVNNAETVFDKAVQATLQDDIQGQNFGCRIENSHVRVGSKIHAVNDFYEAQELFHTPYYLQRFGYLISSNISKPLCRQGRSGDIVLVGYETYSELLTISVENFLCSLFHCARSGEPGSGEAFARRRVLGRIIFENEGERSRAMLRGNLHNSGILDENTNVVLIVPINSTLSTHNKLWAKLKSDQRFSKLAAPFYNMAVILVRTGTGNEPKGLEKEFWDSIDTAHKEISTSLVSPCVNYLISVSTSWRNPLTCECCYPKSGKLIREIPIVNTNKASVIPSQMIGLKTRIAWPPNPSVHPLPRFDPEENQKRISAKTFIGKGAHDTVALQYGHIQCNENHFQYFFNTEVLLKNILSNAEAKKDLTTWLAHIRHLLTESEQDKTFSPAVYHILVIPEHERNATWADEVIREVFSNEAYVLHFNILGEYRDNVKTKCSNISMLYRNLRDAQKHAVLKFHFVDCTITSGQTLKRAQTLMRSLFPDDVFHTDRQVQVRLFESIILILNRISPDTQRSYSENSNFFAYINLTIPQMRNHEDACVLCNLAKQCLTLSKRASSNEVARHWAQKAKKHQVIHIDQLELDESDFYLRSEQLNSLPPEEQRALEQQMDTRRKNAELSFRRLFCAQNLYAEINAQGPKRNDTDWIETRIWFTFLNISDHSGAKLQQAEYLISYIKVLSRPFLTFRKSILEAGFRVRLKLLELLLTGPKADCVDEGMKRFLSLFMQLSARTRSRKTNREKYETLLALLMNLAGSLAKNSSNYVMRKENYAKIFGYFQNVCLPLLPADKVQDNQEQFETWYINTIKRLVDCSGDETKCLWLEKLLLTGSEWGIAGPDPDFVQKYGVGSPFGQRVYLENTRILFDGIRNIYNNQAETEIKDFLNMEHTPPYYLKNFTRFVNGNYALLCGEDGAEPFPNFIENDRLRLASPRARDEILAMRDLYRLLDKPAPCESENDAESPSSVVNTEAFYKKLTEILRKVVGAKQVSLYGEVEHPDRYRDIKQLISERAGQALAGEHLKSPATSKEREALEALTALHPYRTLYEIVAAPGTGKAGGGKVCGLGEEFCNQTPDDLTLLKEVIGWTEDTAREKRTFWLDVKHRAAVVHVFDDGMQPVYFLLLFSPAENTQPDTLRQSMLRGIRNLLAFRHMLVKRFARDFSNDLMPNYMQAKVNKGRLSRKHGWGHTSDRKLDYQMDHLDSNVDDAAHTFEQIMQAYADQICGHLYLKYVQRQELSPFGHLEGQDREPSFQLSLLTKLDGRELMEYGDITARGVTIHLKFHFPDKDALSPSLMVYGKESHIFTVIFLLANNALKYGAASNKAGPDEPARYSIRLSIRREKQDLVISNRMLCESEDTLKKDYVDKAQAQLHHPPVEDESISLWTIGQYIEDVAIQHEWCNFQRGLARSNTPRQILAACTEFMQRLRELKDKCVSIELEYKNGQPQYDENHYISNAIFSVRLPILFEGS